MFYDWAGRLRTVDIVKPGAYFCRTIFLHDRLCEFFEGLKEERWLQGLNQDYFVQRLAYYYGELNAMHPFREGNGRTQRAFFRRLAAAARYRLDWTQLDEGANLEACRANMYDESLDGLIQILSPVVSRIQS